MGRSAQKAVVAAAGEEQIDAAAIVLVAVVPAVVESLLELVKPLFVEAVETGALAERR